jgi:hypothetical protein
MSVSSIGRRAMNRAFSALLNLETSAGGSPSGCSPSIKCIPIWARKYSNIQAFASERFLKQIKEQNDTSNSFSQKSIKSPLKKLHKCQLKPHFSIYVAAESINTLTDQKWLATASLL